MLYKVRYEYIKARFIGTDSLGYKHGTVYILRILKPSRWDYLFHSNPIIIERGFGDGYCPYSSLKTFLKNWEMVDYMGLNESLNATASTEKDS